MSRASGDLPERIRAAQTAADVFPQHPDALLDLAEALLAARQAGEALTYAQASVAACPALARAQAVLAEARLASGDKTAAAQAAGAAVSLNDRDPAGWLASGLVKAKAGDGRGAAADLGKAISLAPASARAHWELSRVLESLHKTSDARTHRERALELEPRAYAGR
jgi:tetratricopeptide (TPR) repeat protein